MKDPGILGQTGSENHPRPPRTKLFALLAMSLVPVAAANLPLELVSVSLDGGYRDSDSGSPSVSADGRYVAFESYATNLVAMDTDTNFDGDVFLRDRVTGATDLVSVHSDGSQGNAYSGSPSISADGRYVAFESEATNLVDGDSNGWTDVFVHDRNTGTTERVSVHSDGSQGNGGSLDPSVSADGRYVAFESEATNLVDGDSNGWTDVFVHDRVTHRTERVSVVPGLGGMDPAISADGRFVAFVAYGFGEVFVHDRVSRMTELVSVPSWGTGQGGSRSPSISADGRSVAFSSYAYNLVFGDSNAQSDVFVRDRAVGTTHRVSVRSDGVQGSDDSYSPSISADGRYVAFASQGTLVDWSYENGIFIHDRVTSMTEFVSEHSDLMAVGGWDQSPQQGGGSSLSADGGVLAFAFGNWGASGDVFAVLQDPDGDGVVGSDDNCPTTYNPNQTDVNGNGSGDACEAKVYTVSPCRVVDTRSADPQLSTFSGDRIAPGETVPFFVTADRITGQGGAADCGIPPEATGVFANVTAVRPLGSGASGYLTLYPYGERQPAASTINYKAETTAVANGVLVARCQPDVTTCDYDLSVYNFTNLSVHLVIDVTGYLAVPTPAP